jgi:pimeloyl-ACP methyl ester carboxylesterase
MDKVYFISGLGADERAFQQLDLSYCHPVFVNWIRPHYKESISNYAKRLYEQINDPDAIIVGLSFGGMMAMQIASQFPVKKVVLLSSCKNCKELPLYLKVLRFIPLHRLLSPKLLKWGNHTAYKLMGISTRHDKVLFTRMLNNADEYFISWGLDTIIHWNCDYVHPNVVHIHGNADYILPIRNVKADYVIEKGDHLMVMSMPDQVSPVLKKAIPGI